MAISLRGATTAVKTFFGGSLHKFHGLNFAQSQRVEGIVKQNILSSRALPHTLARSLSDVAAGAKKISSVSSGKDNGANDCMAKRLGAMRHDSTKKAIDNLVSKLPTLNVSAAGIGIGSLESEYELGKGQPHLGGHGDDGFLTTGAGQNDPQSYQNTVGTWNEFEWGPHFEKLRNRNYVILSILSCHTGAGQDGADLLYAMAKKTNKTVRARTGLTYCGSSGITYEEGSTWQVATPNHKPSPIPSPSHFRNLTSEAIIFKTDGEMKNVDPVDISTVVVSKSPSYTRSDTHVVLDQPDIINTLLKNIDFTPVRFGTDEGGALLGMVTATLSIAIDSLGKTKKFFVYNNNVLQDAEHPDIYYRIMPGFKGLIGRIT